MRLADAITEIDSGNQPPMTLASAVAEVDRSMAATSTTRPSVATAARPKYDPWGFAHGGGYAPNQCGIYARQVLQNFGWKGGSIYDIQKPGYGTPTDKSKLDTGMVVHLKAAGGNTTNHWAIVYRDLDGTLKLNELQTVNGAASQTSNRPVSRVFNRIDGAWTPKGLPVTVASAVAPKKRQAVVTPDKDVQSGVNNTAPTPIVGDWAAQAGGPVISGEDVQPSNAGLSLPSTSMWNSEPNKQKYSIAQIKQMANEDSRRRGEAITQQLISAPVAFTPEMAAAHPDLAIQHEIEMQQMKEGMPYEELMKQGVEALVTAAEDRYYGGPNSVTYREDANGAMVPSDQEPSALAKTLGTVASLAPYSIPYVGQAMMAQQLPQMLAPDASGTPNFVNMGKQAVGRFLNPVESIQNGELPNMIFDAAMLLHGGRMLKRGVADVAGRAIDAALPEVNAPRLTSDVTLPAGRNIRTSAWDSQQMGPSLTREPNQVTLSPKPVVGELSAVAPKVVAEPAPTIPATPPRDIVSVPTKEIVADPNRFQFKLNTNDSGVTKELKDVQTYDPELGGVLLAWKDPADAKTYVVNGHHRLELANRLGVESLPVRYIDAPNAAAARAKGALANIAEGRGTAIDAAKFIRDSDLTPEIMASKGVSLRGKIAADGTALANLNDNVFNRVVQEKMSVERGALIGRELPNVADQDALLAALDKQQAKGKELTDSRLAETIRLAKAAPEATVKQGGLFGDEEFTKNLLLEKAEVSEYVRKQLAGEVSTYNGKVSDSAAAKRLEDAGNKIAVEENQKRLAQAKQQAELYDRQSVYSGPIGDILNESAQKLATGENPALVKEEAYGRIRENLSQNDAAGNGRGVPTGKGAGRPRIPAPRERGTGTGRKPTGRVQPARGGEGLASGSQPVVKTPKPAPEFGRKPNAKPTQGSMLETPDDFQLVTPKGKPGIPMPEPKPTDAQTGQTMIDSALFDGSKAKGSSGGMSAVVDLTPKPKDKSLPSESTPAAPVDKIETPKIKSTLNALAEIWKAPKRVLSPGTVDSVSRMTAETIRELRGNYDRENAIAWELAKKRRNEWDNVDHDTIRQFVNEIETGRISDDPNLATAQRHYRQRTDECYKLIKSVKDYAPYLDDYFPHLWKDKNAAKKLVSDIAGKRPMEGSKSFLKQRKLPTIEDGLNAGLEPVTWNPEELVLLHEMQVRKFVMAHQILNRFKDSGIAEYHSIADRAPDGWKKIDDKIGTVFGNPDIPVSEAFDAQMVTKLRDFIDSLGVNQERTTKIGGDRWGYAMGDQSIATKFGGPESVYSHELGHILDNRYNLADYLMNSKTIKKGPRAGARVSNSVVQNELRALADLRFEGATNVSDSFRKYVRKSSEKTANLVHAYIHTPELMRTVAPNTAAVFDQFIGEHPELARLREIKPSLVLGSNTSTVNAGGMVIRGYWYLPSDAARVINNYLSPGFSGQKWFETARTIGNGMNQVQLGLSFFHAGFTTADVLISHIATGWLDIAEGRIVRGVGRIAISPIEPVRNALNGRAMAREYRNPGTESPVVQSAVNALAAAGGKVTADEFYFGKGSDGLHQNYKQLLRREWKDKDAIGVTKHLVPAMLETISAPVMEYLVPYQKAGLFKTLYEQEMQRFPEATDSQRVSIAQAVWDNVDNRLGQLVYDNLFWRKELKQSLMLGVRSVGWNAGSIREIGGALQDTATTIPRAIERGQWTGTLTQKQAYLFSLVTTTALAGAAITKMMTGENPTGLDYFAPRVGVKDDNGEDIRVQLPTYMRDLIAIQRKGMLRTVRDKFHPLLSSAIELTMNEDWKHDQIRDGSFGQQVVQSLDFLGDQYIPFVIRNATGAKTPNWEKVAGFVGVTKSPRYVTESPAMALMRNYSPDYQDHSVYGQQVREKKRVLRQLIRDAGRVTPEISRKIKESDVVTDKGMNTFVSHALQSDEDRMRTSFKQLNEVQKQRVLAVASSEEITILTSKPSVSRPKPRPR